MRRVSGLPYQVSDDRLAKLAGHGAVSITWREFRLDRIQNVRLNGALGKTKCHSIVHCLDKILFLVFT